MQRRSKESGIDTFLYLLMTVALYFSSQTVIVLLHEHAHSSMAWFLGYSSTPFTVVWGNPLTMRGWDEGVPYDQLFARKASAAESLIGGVPLFMHATLVALGLYLLLRERTRHSRLAFLMTYWFVIANMAELVAYLWMRPSIPTGDTGRFNAGLHLSPWPLFLVGSALLFFALVFLDRRVMPVLDTVAGGGARRHWINVACTAFFMFLWSSGVRIFSLYPDPQWKWGLSGLIAFAGWMSAGLLRSDRDVNAS